MTTFGHTGLRRRGQAGFTLVELLVTAFILGVGILGLSLLQVMSIKASRGGRSLSTASLVAEKVMDQVELEGRLTWTDITSSQYNTKTTGIPLKYIDKDVEVVDTFNIYGAPPDTAWPPGDPRRDVYFTARTLRTGDVGGATTGEMHDFRVTVEFFDETAAVGGAKILRTVQINRRVVHGY